MRPILRAALAAIVLVCAPSARAQQQTTPYAGRGPNTLTFSVVGLNDTATIYLAGSSWSSVYWTIATAGSGAITTEVSLDGGTNWLPSAYSRRLDAVSANPSIAPWANNGPVAGTYETPLPGNCTAFRIRYQTAGTATSGTLTPGVAYTPGSLVTATLADVSESGTGAGIAATIYDISGWANATAYALSPTGQVFTIRVVDDAGTALNSGMSFTFTAATGATVNFSRNGGHTAFASATLTAGQWVSGVTAERRISVTLPAGGTVAAGRYRITASR